MSKLSIVSLLEAEEDSIFEAILRKYPVFSEEYDIVLDSENYLLLKHKYNTLPITCVAHIDTVCTKKVKVERNNNILYNKNNGPVGGDDRCGVFIILSLVERGLRPNILLTRGEEKGCVGANAFCKDNPWPEIRNQYAFIEWDRRGVFEFVVYDNDNTELASLITSLGFEERTGSVSDVRTLSTEFGVAHVNMGSAYFNQHTANEYVSIPGLYACIKMGEKILAAIKKPYVYTKKAPIVTSYVRYTTRNSTYFKDVCWFCGKEVDFSNTVKTDSDGTVFCKVCARRFYNIPNDVTLYYSGCRCTECKKLFVLDDIHYSTFEDDPLCLECYEERIHKVIENA